MKAIDERKDLQELEKERKVISYLPSAAEGFPG